MKENIIRFIQRANRAGCFFPTEQFCSKQILPIPDSFSLGKVANEVPKGQDIYKRRVPQGEQ